MCFQSRDGCARERNENGAIQGVPYEHPDNSAFAGYRSAALAKLIIRPKLGCVPKCRAGVDKLDNFGVATHKLDLTSAHKGP